MSDEQQAQLQQQEDQRHGLLILGRNIGTVSGWDQADTQVFGYYDFEPIEGIKLPPAAVLRMDYESGILDVYVTGDEGKPRRFDMVKIIQKLPREA